MRYTWSALASIVVGVLGFANPILAAPAVNVATAPDARSVAIGTPATIFVEFVNSGADTAINCRIAKPVGVPIDLAYQTLDAGGALTGAPDTPANVAAGASQRFLVTFTATAAFEGRIHLNYACDNFTPFVFEDVNDLFLTASAGDPPDMIAIFATPSGDGVMRVAAPGGAQAAGGAVVNIGSAGGAAIVDVTPTFGDFDEGLGVTLSICETDPGTGACMAPPAGGIQMNIGGVAKTFSVFAIANEAYGVSLFPEYVRVSVVFSDQAIDPPTLATETSESGTIARPAAIFGTIRGRGSVAFTAPSANIPDPDISIFAGEYKLRMRDLQFDPNSDFISVGTLNVGTNGVATGIYHRFNAFDGDGNFIGEMDQVFALEGLFDPIVKTFAGEMIFIPDLFLNTPPLRGNFVANFDPGRSVRGTYSFLSNSEEPEKEKATRGLARQQSAPGGSPNIQATGMHWLAIQNCAIVRNIPSSKVFDVYLRDIKIGTATINRSGAIFNFSGMITVAEGDFNIAGNLENAESVGDFFEDINFLDQPFMATKLTIKEASGEQKTVLEDGDIPGGIRIKRFGEREGKLVTGCSATGFSIEFYQHTATFEDPRSVSLVLEFRMPMP